MLKKERDIEEQLIYLDAGQLYKSIFLLFCKGQRGCYDLKIVYISNFSQFRSEERGGGGVFKFLLFPKFKKVPIILGGTLGSDVTLNS